MRTSTNNLSEFEEQQVGESSPGMNLKLPRPKSQDGFNEDFTTIRMREEPMRESGSEKDSFGKMREYPRSSILVPTKVSDCQSPDNSKSQVENFTTNISFQPHSSHIKKQTSISD